MERKEKSAEKKKKKFAYTRAYACQNYEIIFRDPFQTPKHENYHTCLLALTFSYFLHYAGSYRLLFNDVSKLALFIAVLLMLHNLNRHSSTSFPHILINICDDSFRFVKLYKILQTF